MRRTKLTRYVAVITALSMIAVSPMTALAETEANVEQVTVYGEGGGTYESVSNTEGKTGIEMNDGAGATALNGNVTITGDVSVSNKDVEPHEGLEGISIYSARGGNATVKVSGSVNVDGSKEGSDCAYGISTDGDATSNITIGRDVKVTSDDVAYGINSSNRNDIISIGGNVDVKANRFGEGIVIFDNTDMTVGGDVNASSTEYTAIGVDLGCYKSKGDLYIGGSINASGVQASGIFIISNNMSSSKGNEINVTVGEDIDATSDILGVGIEIYKNDKNINITVEGDIKGTNYGILATGTNTGEVSIVSGGTISSEKDAAIVVAKPSEGENAPEITVWKIESGTDNLVETIDGYDEYAKEFEKTINYIIKADATENDKETSNGKIVLTSESKLGEVTIGSGDSAKTYKTANQDQQIIINVQVADGYKYSLSNGDAVLTANPDGSYTITIPEGGGVDLRAVLEKIEEQRNSTRNSDRYYAAGVWVQ